MPILADGHAPSRCHTYLPLLALRSEDRSSFLCGTVGDPIKIRTRRFPALVNCVVIDWFQPWPEEALTSVSKRFLSDVELGDDQSKENIMMFMPYSFLQVNKISELYESQERRFNYTTPKSFLELIALYKAMLADRRAKIDVRARQRKELLCFGCPAASLPPCPFCSSPPPTGEH